jgi:hypothetical protein
MAANHKCGGAPMVQGRFFRVAEGTFGFSKQRRNMYVAMFPKQGEPSHEKTMLLWAYDDVAACRRAPDGDDNGDDEHATRGAIELITPSAEMETEGKKKGKGKDDRKYSLTILSSKAGKKGGKGKLVEVWRAYAENKETATDWYHVLAEEEDGDDDEDDDDDDEDDD